MDINSIKQSIRKGKKSWIQNFKKEDLEKIAVQLDIDITSIKTLDDLRSLLRNYVDKEGGGDKGTQQIQCTMSFTAQLDNFNGGNWDAFKEQFECYLLLNDIPEKKGPISNNKTEHKCV